MKKLFLLFFISFFLQKTYAQFWIEAGIKGASGVTLLYNPNIFDDPNASYKMKSDFAVGPRIGLNFNESHGLSIEGLYSQSRAYYAGKPAGSTSVQPLNYDWNNIDAYVMYRYFYERSFIEIGPKLSTLRGITQNTVDVTDKFNKTNLGAAFGFGGFLAGGENLSLSLNFRFDYQFSDFVGTAGKAATNAYPFTFSKYDSYSKTSPIVGRIGLDMTFALGGTAKAQCGRRVVFFGGGR